MSGTDPASPIPVAGQSAGDPITFLPPGVVLPIAHIVLDNDGLSNLRRALNVEPPLPDPYAGEAAGAYAQRTHTNLSPELPPDFQYDPWRRAPDNTFGWWKPSDEPFGMPPDYRMISMPQLVTPFEIADCVPASYFARIGTPIAFLRNLCGELSKVGMGIAGVPFVEPPPPQPQPSVELARQVCTAAWVEYTGGGEDSASLNMTDDEVATFFQNLLTNVAHHEGDQGDGS